MVLGCFLTEDEICIIKRYIDEHWDEVMEEDRRIEERRKTQKNSPEIERILLEGRAKRLALMEQLKPCHDFVRVESALIE